MGIYLGPDRARWVPETWSDLLEAAAGGALDESHWVELKAAIPPKNANSNLELARDLASLAVSGGLLVVGIKDDNDRAGDVSGTDLHGLADRIDQVSRDRISPPLVVRPIEVADPDRPGLGCLLVVVDASSGAPHMVDQKYWGRGATGKRVLTDLEVRNTLELNYRRQAEAEDELAQLVRSNPLKSAGCIYVLAAPRSSRRGVLAAQIDDQRWVYEQIDQAVTVDSDRQGWWLGTERIRRTVDGIDVCAVDVETIPVDRAPLESTLRLLRVAGTGRVELTVESMVGTAGNGNAQPLLWIEGVQVLTRATLTFAGLMADAAAYGGVWDVGIALTDLRGAQIGRRSAAGYGAGSRGYPDESYTRLAQATSADLVEDPVAAADQLLDPLLRVLT